MPSVSSRKVCGKGDHFGRAWLWLTCAAFGTALLVVPGTVQAGDAIGPTGLKVLLASASNLTDGEMAAQTAGSLPLAAPVPDLQVLRPKVRLWDELVPTISAAAQNQAATVTVHTGP